MIKKCTFNANKSKDSYEALKKILQEKDENQRLHPQWLALVHIQEMERTIEHQEEELKKYREFFGMLNSFLPKDMNYFNENIG